MSRPTHPTHVTQGVVVLMTAAGLVALGLPNGSYDVVPRQTGGVILWWLVGLGALLAPRPPRWSSRPAFAAFAASLAMVVWIAVNSAHSISHERTGTELARDLTHVAPLLLVGCVLPRTWWRAVATGAVLAGVTLVVLAFAHRLSPGLLGETTAPPFEQARERLAFPLGYWNAVGSWATITLLLLTANAAHAQRRWIRALGAAFVPLCIAVAYLTYSRSAIGAAAFGAIVLVAASRNRFAAVGLLAASAISGAAVIATVHGQHEIATATGTAGAGSVLGVVVLAGAAMALVSLVLARFADGVRMARRPAIGALTLAIVVGLIAGAVLVNRFGERAWEQLNNPVTVTAAQADPTARLTQLNGTRLQQWRGALDAWEEQPIRGYGAGTFELIWNQRSPTGEFVRDAHNNYVETLAEQGLAGLFLLLAFVSSVVACVVLALRRARSDQDRGVLAGVAAATAAFLLGTGVDWFWEVSALAMLSLTLMGAALAASGGEAADLPESGGSRIPGWGRRAAVVILAIVAVLVELPGLVGTSEVRRSAREVGRGDLVAARSHADQAIEILPWASSPFLQRALVDEQAGSWRTAARAARLAEQRDPQDWRIPLVLARIEAEAGHVDASLAALRRAEKLRPHSNFFR